MMRVFGLTLVLMGMISLATAQIQIVKIDQLEEIIDNNSAELKVVNFWATWCGPCVKELPHFEEIDQRSNVTVNLVSLDFIQDLDRVEKFIIKKKLKSRTLLLDESDYDSYMPRIAESWSGAIPATLMIDTEGNRYFYESAFTRDALLKEIDKFVN